MEAHLENPLQPNGFDVDRGHKTDIIEWKKKRKLYIDQFDLHRPKHKCWIRNSENDPMFDESRVFEKMHAYAAKGKVPEDISEHESVKDSNSSIEDSNSNTTMSIDEGGKLDDDSANTFLYGRGSTSFDDKEEAFVDKELYPSSHYADLHALDNLEDHFLGLVGCTDHMYSEYAKDNIEEESADKDFKDIFGSKGENPNKFVLSSGRWNVDQDQEAESNSRPPTIDEEFEQYFSMLML